MKILITGGTGYIGSHTTVELLHAGYEVVICDNLSNSHADVVDRIEQITGKKPFFYKIDLRDMVAFEEVFQSHSLQAVLHFAGYKAAGESVDYPLRYYENNLVSTLNLLLLMEKYQVNSLVFSSSAVVYGNSKDAPFKEDLPVDFAINPYGRTKAMIELVLEDLARRRNEMGIVALRYFNPLGASKSGLLGENLSNTPTNIMPIITKVAAGEISYLSVFGDDYPTKDGTGVRDYLHIEDLAKGHLAALEYSLNNAGFNIVNLGTGNGTSVLELIDAFESANNVKIPYRIVERRKGDIAFSLADPHKAWELFGWRTERTLEDMCRDAWRWQNSFL
jgi:UDP-glucose 4-epimerase